MHKIILIMENLLSSIHIKVNNKTFVKDPESSSLGKKIIQESIILINEVGFEEYTFKKLGERIGSNESSIYRYFENKHKLLVYLSSWYWSWIEYRLVFSTQNMENKIEKLKKAIEIVTEKIEDDTNTAHINESILNKIIIEEFTKTLHTKAIDKENKEGYFLIYKRIINRICNMVEDINPEYPYAKSLISTIIEGALHQHFLKEHLTSITNCNETLSPTTFYTNLVFNNIKPKI